MRVARGLGFGYSSREPGRSETTMSVNLKKVAKDLVCEDQDIRILALTTVVQLTSGSVEDRGDLPILKERLTEATELDDPDTVFLARKGLNHVASLMEKVAAEGEAETVESLPSELSKASENAPKNRASALAQLEQAGEEPIRLANALADLATAGPAPEDLPRVVPLLRSDDARVRANAVEVIEALEVPSLMIQSISPLLEDENHRVRANAQKALGRLGHPEAVRTLSAMAQSGNLAEREAAVYAMSFLKGPEVLDLLAKALRDPYEGIRLRAVKGLGRLKDPACLPVLKQALNDMDIDVCEEAARAVRYISMESPQPLRDGYEQVGSHSAATQKSPSSGLSPEHQQKRQEALLAFGQKIFLALRQGTLDAPTLKRGFYDVVKAQEFLAKQRQRLEAGEAMDHDTQQAKQRIEQSIRIALIDLGRGALDLEAAGEPAVPGASEVRLHLKAIDQQFERDGLT